MERQNTNRREGRRREGGITCVVFQYSFLAAIYFISNVNFFQEISIIYATDK